MERGEFELIERYFRPLVVGDARRGTDDAAILTQEQAGRCCLVAADGMTQGVHFFADAPPETIARKALRVNLSDMAAMGGIPRYYLMVLMLTDTTTETWVSDFARGLRLDQETYNVTLLGGDLIGGAAATSVSVTMMGEPAQTQSPCCMCRNSARDGDDVYVSGTLGDAALALNLRDKSTQSRLSETQRAFLEQRLLLPEPRLVLGQKLGGVAHACIDVSDGLLADLTHVCRASNVGMSVNVADVPLSEAFRCGLVSPQQRQLALVGGDDYELAFTASKGKRGDIEALAATVATCGVSVTRIGHVHKGSGVKVYDEKGVCVDIDYRGYRHLTNMPL